MIERNGGKFMNRVFKVIWSHARNAYVVVSEIALNHGKNTKGSAGAVHLKKALIAALLVSGTFGGTLYGGMDSYAVDLGNQAAATYDAKGNLAIGKNVKTEGKNNSGSYNTAIGTDTDTIRDDGTGNGQAMDGSSNTKLVDGEGQAHELERSTEASSGTQEGSTALGYNSHAEGDASTAIGNKAAVKNAPTTYYADADGNKTTSQNDAAWYADGDGKPTKVPQVFRDADNKTTTTPQYIHTYTEKDATTGQTVTKTEITTDATKADKNADGSLKYNYQKADNLDKLYSVTLYQPSSNSIAAGSEVEADGENAVAVGYQSTAKSSAVAIGDNAKAEKDTVAIGKEANASAEGGVALGMGSTADRSGGVTGWDPKTGKTSDETTAVWKSGNGVISVGNGEGSRQITNVAAGSEDSDAVNLAQLKKAMTHYYSVKTTEKTDQSGNNNYLNDGATGDNALAAGVNAKAFGDNSTAVGTESQAQERDSAAYGYKAIAFQEDSTAMGSNAQAQARSSTAYGSSAIAKAVGSTVIGYGSTAQGEDSVAVGGHALADYSVQIGTSSTSQGESSVAVGGHTKGEYSVAVGVGSTAQSKNSVAVGGHALGENSVQVGSGNTAQGKNSVAVGGHALGENTVEVGIGSTAQGANSVSVGGHSIGQQSTAIGNGSNSAGYSSTAIGGGSTHNYQETAVGYGSVTSGGQSVTVGGTATGSQSVSVGNNANATSQQATTVGFNTSATGSQSTALGYNSHASNSQSVAIGGSTANSNQAVAIGSGAAAGSYYNGYSGMTAIGQNSHANGNGSTALGNSTDAGGLYTSAIGYGSNAYGSYTMAMGGASVNGTNSIAVGNSATAQDTSSIAIGNASNVSGTGSIGIGSGAKASNSGTAVGYGVQAGGSESTAIGVGSQASGANATAIGGGGAWAAGSVAIGSGAGTNTNAVSIGKDSNAWGVNGVSLGTGSSATGLNSTAIGGGKAYSDDGIAIGSNAQTNKAITIGKDSSAWGDSAVAIGENTNAWRTNSIVLGKNSESGADKNVQGFDPITGKASKDTSATWNSTDEAVSFGRAEEQDEQGNVTKTAITRQLNNVAAGTLDTDAVNVAQLKLATTKINMHYYSVHSTETGDGSNYANDGATGTNALAAGVSASASGAHSVAVGNGATATGTDAIALGTNAKAEGQGALVVGEHNSATGQNAIAFGGGYGKDEKGNTASAVASVAFGENTTAKAEGTVAFGYGTQAGSDRTDGKGKNYGQDAVAFGRDTKALGGRSLAFGENTVADYNDSVAFGNASKALSTGAVAFGSRTRALAQYSTAFGNRAVSAGNYATAFGTDTLAGVKTDASGAMWLTNGTKIDANGNEAYTDGSGNTYAVENFRNVKNGQPSGETHNYVVVKGTDGKAYIQDYHGDIHAVTLTKQADGTIKATASTDIAKGITLVTADPTSTNGYDFVDYDNATAFGESTKAINVNATAFGKNSVASGENSLAFGEGSTASGNNSVAGLGGTASTSNSIALGKDTKANNKDNAVSVAIGENAEASGARSLAIGFGVSEKVGTKDDTNLTQTTASGESAVSIGTDTQAAGQHSLAMGSHTSAAKDSSIAIGYDTHAVNDSTVAIGSGTQARGRYSVAMGLSSVAGTETNDANNPLDGGGSVAIGYAAAAKATRSVAIGTGSSAYENAFTTALGDSSIASQRGSVALGAGSNATRAAGNLEGGTEYKKAYLMPDTATADDITWTSTEGAVSVGGTTKYIDYDESGKKVTKTKNITRQITNVAAGSEDTDAVNVAQLKRVKTAIDSVAGAHTALTVNDKSNPTAAEVGEGKYGEYAGGESDNLHIAAMEGTDGKVTYNIKLNDQLSIGKNGKDGTDGKVTVDTRGGTTVIIGHDGKNGDNGRDGLFVRGDDGKDGKSGISITGPNGLDGGDGIDGTIGIAGKDGKDAVSISGKDGAGHIGLTGPKGADGKDGTSIDLSTDYGTKTLHSEKNTTVDGVEKASRIIYSDAKGDHEVATMDDGQKYAGDNYVAATDKEAEKNGIVKKLNERLDIRGGATGALTDNNIGVNAVDGVLKVQLAQKIDLTKDGSVTMGKTVVNNDGLKITNDDADETKNVTINGDTVSFGGNQVKNMGSGSDGKDEKGNPTYNMDTNGANIGDVKKIAGNTSAELTAKGLDFVGNNDTVTVHRDLGTKLTIKGEGTKEDANYSGENLKVIGNANGTLTIVMDKDIKGNSLTVGEKGEKGSEGQPGKDGVDGMIGINGKDGSAVVINGKDGSIGLNGKDGANGLTIRGANGEVGVNGTDGKDGKDGMTRIVYQDAKGTDHSVATLDDGQKYKGDFGDVANVALNHQVNIVGDISSYNVKNPNNKVEEKDLTDGVANVGVVTTKDDQGNATLTIKMNKNLKGLNTVAAGNDSVFGKQDVTNTQGVKESGDYVTGLDNKTWDGKTYVSGRAATEDQLHQAVSDLIGPGANGGFGLSANGGKVTQALGKTIAVNGDGTYKADGTETKAGNISTSVKDRAIQVSLNRDLNIDSTTMEKTNDDGSKVTNKTTAEGSTIVKTDASGKTMASTTANAGSLTITNGNTSTVINENGVSTNKVTVGKDTTIDDGSAKIGKVTIHGNGENDGNDQHKSTITGLSNTTFDTNHTEQYENSGRAATEAQLKQVYDKASQHTTVTVNGKPSASGNLKLDTTTNDDGSTNYAISLNNDVTLGDNDKDGKLTVKSQDGTKSITTDGKEGTLTFQDGNHTASMKAAESVKAVDGTTDIKRVAVDGHTVATMDDGMKFAGDSGEALQQKLNSTTNIKGGAAGELSDGNIGVVSDGKDTLTVKLAKDIKGLNSVEATTINATTVNSSTFNAGNTTMDNSGVTIKTGDSGRTITIKDGGVSMGGNQIHNVAPGTAPDDAVNVSQLNATNGVVNKLGSRINKVGAGAAALAALHPLDFDPDDKWDVAAGYGHYKNADAAAIGAFYQPNEDTMLSIGGSFGGGENMVNAGVSVKLGQGNHVSTSRVAMAKEIRDLRENVAKLNDVVNRQSALIDKLTGVNAGTIQDRGNDLFPDVPANHWAYEYVTALHKAGILEGYPDGTFSGDRMMTRYEFAAIVYRAIMAGAASNPALNRDGTLDKLAKEFSSEMKYIRIDTISKDRNGNPDIQRVRVISQKQEKK